MYFLALMIQCPLMVAVKTKMENFDPLGQSHTKVGVCMEKIIAMASFSSRSN